MRLSRHRGQGQRRAAIGFGTGTVVPAPSGTWASPRFTLPDWLTHSVTTNKLTGEPFASIDPTTYFTGTVHNCGTLGELTTALANCVDTDVIRLTADISVTSTQIMRNRGTSGWVKITSDGWDTPPVALGTRVSPATHGSSMRALSSTSVHTVLKGANGGGGYYLVGFKITKDAGASNNGAPLLDLGGNQTVITDVPQKMELRHMWVTNPWTTSGPQSRRGIFLRSRYTKIRDCYIDGHAESGSDSQAIVIWDTPGDFDIHNNFLEGASENILFGGAQSNIGSDGLVRNGWIHQNYFFKRTEWLTGGAGASLTVRKNFYEMKQGSKIVWEGNVNDNFDGTGQAFDINFGCKPQSAAEEAWNIVKNVYCRYNISRFSAAPFQIISADNDGGDGVVDGTARIQMLSNLWHAQAYPTGNNRPQLYVANGQPDIAIENNTFNATSATCVLSPTPALGGSGKSPGLIFQNNINYGNTGSVGPIFQDAGNQNTAALNDACGSGLWTVKNNVVNTRNWDATLANAPNNNKTAANLAAIGFLDQTNMDYTLSGGSIYKNTGTDGNDPGVNMSFLSTLTAGVINGNPTL